jgi:hypothetical protein
MVEGVKKGDSLKMGFKVFLVTMKGRSMKGAH